MKRRVTIGRLKAGFKSFYIEIEKLDVKKEI
jgi:hypothetical protein